MAEKRTGVGSHLSGVLERSAPPRPVEEIEEADPAVADASEGEPSARSKGRGAAKATPRAPSAKPAKKAKGRTIYLDDALFERVVVQSLRRGKTISEYVAAILERQVPDHRTIRADESDEG